jgi:hypothetical protein
MNAARAQATKRSVGKKVSRKYRNGREYGKLWSKVTN